MHINIQSVELSDIPTIAEMDKRCLPYDYWNEKSFEYAVNHLEDISYRYIFLKAVDSQAQTMGYIVATVVAEDCEVQSIAVDVPFRRRNVAKRLLNQLFLEVFGIASNIYLEVRKSNTSALNLYQKVGFEILGSRKNYYDYPREDAILMAKSLTE